VARRGVYVLVDVFLPKPFALSALLARVRAVLEAPPEPPAL
jgi:DNA-binding response OmpR family regulator